MPVNYAEQALMAEMLTRPRLWSQLSEKNKIAVNSFIDLLLDFQEKAHDGKILTHINGGVACQIEPTPKITIKH